MVETLRKRAHSFVCFCLLMGYTAMIAGAGFICGFHRGVSLGRSEIITMAVRNRVAYWVIDRDGVALLEWRYVPKVHETCVKRTNERHGE